MHTTTRTSVRTMILAAAAVTGPAVAQTDTLYVADGMGSLYTAKGGAFTSAGQAFGGEQAIAVDGDVRTQANWGGTGQDYNLSLTPLIPTYADPGVGPFYDGTTDGKHNFAHSQGDGWVYQMDRNWQNPKKLFNPGFVGGFGITWDGTDNSLWLSSMSGIVNYTMTGAPGLQATITRFEGWEAGLAWEPSTDTLWVSGHFSGGLLQFDKLGNYGLNYGAPWGMPQSGVGMEFDLGPAVPGPGPAALLGLSGLIAANRRRPNIATKDHS